MSYSIPEDHEIQRADPNIQDEDINNEPNVSGLINYNNNDQPDKDELDRIIAEEKRKQDIIDKAK